MDKKQLRQLLAQNRIEPLFKALNQLAEEKKREDLQEELAELEGRWEAYQQMEREGTASFEQLGIEHNKIRKALSQLIKHTFQPPKATGKQKRHPLFWPAIIASACVILTVIGYLPSREAIFEMDAQTEFIQVTLAEEWDIDFDFYMHEFETNQLEALVLPDTIIESEAPDLKLLASGGQVQLADIILPDGAEISLLNENENGWQLDVKDQSVYGALETKEAMIQIEQADQLLFEQTYPGNADGSPEIIEFQTREGASFYADVCEECPFKISRLGVQAVSFYWSPDKEEFESSLQADGQLSVNNSKNITLKEKDEVQFTELSETFLTLERNKDGFQVSLEGKAENIKHGYKGKLSSLKPNLIQSLMHNNNAKLFYTTLVWLLGIGLGIWTTLGKFKKTG